MRLLKIHKDIRINKCIGNVNITSQGYAVPKYDSEGIEHYTVISCWYDKDCEHCPMGWEDMSYEGECNDCGCSFDYNFNVPFWKCMLPKWIKRIIIKIKKGANVE